MIQNLANRIVIDPIKIQNQTDLPEDWNVFIAQDVDAFEIILDKGMPDDQPFNFPSKIKPVRKNKRNNEL